MTTRTFVCWLFIAVNYLRLSTTLVGGMSEAEKVAILEAHNNYRRSEAASNMDKLLWDDAAASVAQRFTDVCINMFAPAESTRNGYGVNIYTSPSPHVDMTNMVVARWYSEKADYDYETNACSDGKSCDHYKQLVWASSHLVGCAYTDRCTVATPGGYVGGMFLMCLYSPAGNFPGQKPYEKGHLCTQCSSGQFYCNDGLCDRSCKAASKYCECAAVCRNCARTTDECRCTCITGWAGPDCTKRCIDDTEKCGADKVLEPSLCETSNQTAIEYCPKMCHTCTPGEPTCYDIELSTQRLTANSVTDYLLIMATFVATLFITR